MLPGSSRPSASAANTADTLRSPCARIGRDQLGLAERHARHVVVRRRDRPARASPAAAASSASTCGLHEPQPVPARVASHERLQAAGARRHRRHDAALRDAVAVADLRVVGQLGHRAAPSPRRRRGRASPRACRAAARRGRTSAGGMGPAEASPSRIAPASAALAHDQLLVDAARGVGVDGDLVGLARRLLLAHHRQLDAHHLQLRAHGRSRRRRRAGARPVSRSASTRVCSQSGATRPYTLPAVLRALAHRVDARVVRRGEVVAHHDAALHGERRRPGPARRSGGCRPRSPPGRSRASSRPRTARPVTRSSPRIARVALLEVHAEAQPAQRAQQHPAGRGIELHLHQVRHQVDDVDLEALLEQAARGLQAEQAAADHRRHARRSSRRR